MNTQNTTDQETPDAIESASSSPALDHTPEAASKAETIDLAVEPYPGRRWSLVHEASREDRAHNIATIYLGAYAEWDGLPTDEKAKQTHVPTAPIRAEIRSGLALPALEGQAFFGDLWAHSDAAGGHGLKLESEFKIVEGKRTRCLTLSEVNRDICREYLARPAGFKFKFKFKREGTIPACVFIPNATEASE